jgi:FkbM family methyltransferase
MSEVRFCKGRLEPGATMLDVGGNIGLYALLAAKLVGPTGRVHTFEPEPRNAARLRANVALNELTNVEVFENAVYSEPGTVLLNVFGPQYNAWHSLGSPELPDPVDARRTVTPSGRREVRAVTLDEHCEQNSINCVELLKIDAEGAEVDALLGASSLLAQHAIRAILFEISLPQIEALGHAPDEPFRVLADAGYGCFRLGDDGAVGDRVTSTTTRYANYVALPPDA